MAHAFPELGTRIEAVICSEITRTGMGWNARGFELLIVPGTSF